MKWMLTLSFFLSFFLLCPDLHAQELKKSIDPVGIAKNYIQTHLTEWGMTERDVLGMTINDSYTDKNSGITRIYFLQRYNGFPVYNAILNLNINKEGKVFFSGNRFIPDLDNKINATVPKLSPDEAVAALITHLDLPNEKLQMKRSAIESEYIFDKGNIATEDITAQLAYQPDHGKVKLAWDILMSPQGTNDKWSTRIDAVTGAVLDENNWTVYCGQDGKAINGEENPCQVHPDSFNSTGEFNSNASTCANETMTGAQYNVWPAPLASPAAGPRLMVTDPFDPIASPYGWHDTDGSPGAEYTITRGNNVHAYLDWDGTGQNNHNEPDGGPNLQFDFPFDPTQEPDHYADAAQVNLFYWANYMHDFAYRFGFDEEAGNYQQNNYGRGGKGNDYIKLRAQFGANIDTSNNAFFSYASEGSSPAMQMMLFRGLHNYLKVNEPAIVAGKYRTSPPGPGWGAGAYVTTTPITAEVVAVDDGYENPYSNDACETILNADQLNGKIALVERGGCQFGYKALQVQNAGAIGMICGNIDDNNYTMKPGQYGEQVQIPVVLISESDCKSLKRFIGTGLKVSLVDPQDENPKALDSDLDNTMISHEYGHGISNRLVGGASTSCLRNAEEMGEGWSDFFSLVVTTKSGNPEDRQRGFATYVMKDPSGGKGYRTYPYSTDLSITPLTYGDISSIQETHDLGQVWCTMLWDMYWTLVDQYGWNADPYYPSSGNYRAIKLVMEGLKNVPCSPGFVDGRDAILAADESLYDGVDVCTLWKVFARRGLGFSADQGSSFDAGDQKEAFDVPPTCTDQILVNKSVTDFIHPGDEIKVKINVGNYKNETATNVRVTDEIPEGTHYKMNSANIPAQVQGNMISFELGNMPSQDTITISYTLSTDPGLWSRRIYLDEVSAQSSSKWLSYTLGDAVPNVWHLTNEFLAHTGDMVWNVAESTGQSRQVLELNPDQYTFHVEGNHPVLRFYHRMKAQGGTSGGIVEVREVGTSQWEEVNSNFLRNGYTVKMDYRTFLSPGVYAFSGNSGDAYKASYVDLSRWAGKDVQIRFLFGTIPDSHGGAGWMIDDIEFMDMINYNGEACMTTDQGDLECLYAPESGTIVESREDVTSVVDQTNNLPFSIYPNPASDHITIAWPNEQLKNITLSLQSIDGRTLFTETYPHFNNNQLNINTNNVPSGLYLIKVSDGDSQYVGKVVMQQ